MTGASGRTGAGWARWTGWSWWTLRVSFSGDGHYFFGFFCTAFRAGNLFFFRRWKDQTFKYFFTLFASKFI